MERDLPLNRRVIRKGALEHALDNFNQLQALEVAQVLKAYDARLIEPLRQRLDWLERPLVVRAWLATWYWVLSVRDWLVGRFMKPETLVGPKLPVLPEQQVEPPSLIVKP